jgi:hypothetical protein
MQFGLLVKSNIAHTLDSLDYSLSKGGLMNKNVITCLPSILGSLESIRSHITNLDATTLSDGAKDRLKAVLNHCTLIEGLYEDAVTLSCGLNFPNLPRHKETVHA